MIRTRIAPELAAEWQPLLERQLRLTLASVQNELERAELRFEHVEDSAAGAMYCCEFNGNGVDGERYRAVTRHSDGRSAAADTLARIRRAIIRGRRRDLKRHRAGRFT